MQVWMTHRDQVATVPAGFRVLGGTDTCAVAAMSRIRSRPLWRAISSRSGAYRTAGHQILANFVFGVCGCEKDWDPEDRVPR